MFKFPTFSGAVELFVIVSDAAQIGLVDDDAAWERRCNPDGNASLGGGELEDEGGGDDERDREGAEFLAAG